MGFQITDENQILDQATRAKIIEQIRAPENTARKEAAYRRYLVFKDLTKRMVLEQLLLQFDESTVREMSYAISNISIVKKVIGKLARVYSNGVRRTVMGKDGSEDVAATKSLEDLAKVMKFDGELKKANRFLKLQKNMMLYIRPQICEADQKWQIKADALQPYLYDVIEYPRNKQEPWMVIMSAYNPPSEVYTTLNAATANRATTVQPLAPKPMSDGVDQAIADPDDEKEKGEFVWWTPNYHFTTNGKGVIISQPVNDSAQSENQKYANPIGKIPFVNFAIDQDGEFWAMGGDDLVDGGILLNSMLSQTNHIGVVQGYGQFWARGKTVPPNMKIGPSHMIRLEYDKDDPVPEIGFASANPALDKLLTNIETQVAMLLTTNNLSTSTVSGELKGAATMASGIAQLIDKAESREDVQDQEQIFKDGEPPAWNLVRDWQTEFPNLDEEFKKALPKDKFGVELAFAPTQTLQSEGEKLDNIGKRAKLGLNMPEELIMMDNPGMTAQAATEKLAKIKLSAQQAGGDMVNDTATETDVQDPANETDQTDPAASDNPNPAGNE